MTEPQAVAREGSAAHSAERKTRVFISYSRKDAAFADRIVSALNERGYDAYLDKKDILPGEPWKERLGSLILGADAVAFLITPDSMASEICAWEVDETERLQKRLLPVLHRPVPDAHVPPRLARLNYVFLRTEDDFGTGIITLGSSIDTDISWIRQHTRIGEIAKRWEDAGRPATGGRLMRGEELAEAEKWLLSSPKAAPDPTDAQRAYVQASRAFETAEVSRTRRTQKRAAWALGGVAVLAIGGLVAAIWQSREAERREARVLTSIAQRAIDEGQFDRAARVALFGLPARGTSPLSIGWSAPEIIALEAKLAGAAQQSRFVRAIPGQSYPSFSPDGKHLLTTSDDGAARIWDVATGKEIAVLSVEDHPVEFAIYSPNGTHVVTALRSAAPRIWNAADANVVADLGKDAIDANLVDFNKNGNRIITTSGGDSTQVWDAGNGRLIAVFKEHSENALYDTPRVVAAQFSPNGSRIVTGSSVETARIWSAETGGELVTVKHECSKEARSENMEWECSVNQVVFNSTGTRILTASQDLTARLWDVSTGKQLAIFSGHTKNVHDAAFSPDEKLVITSSYDQTLRLWEAATGKELAVIRHTSDVNDASFSPDGKRIITAGGDQVVHVWDAGNGEEIGVLAGHSGPVERAEFSPDGKWIASASRDNTVRIWRTTSSGDPIVLIGHKGQKPNSAGFAPGDVNSAKFSPDGKLIATASMDDTARLWDAATGRQIAKFADDNDLYCAAFSPDGTRLVTSSEGQLWDTKTGKPIAKIAKGLGLLSCTFSPDGKSIVASTVEEASIWDVKNRKQIASFSGHKGPVWSARFSPDGSRIVTASDDATARIWNAETGKEIALFSGHFPRIASAAFNPDGKTIVTGGGDFTARIWDLANGAQLGVLKGHTDVVLSANFSPDGSRVVTSSGDDTVRVWDTVTGAEIAVFRGHKGSVSSAEFSPDGTRIVTASQDNTARIWDVTWIGKMRGSNLRDRACSEKLIGATKFTDDELRDPIFSDVDKDDHVDRNPCLRRGPLSVDYYTRAAAWGRKFADWRRWSSQVSEKTRPSTLN